MDSAFQLCDIKNIVIVSNKKTKKYFLEHVYPFNIDCIVLTQKEAEKFKNQKYNIIFIGCYLEIFKDCENIILDNFLKLNFQLNKDSNYNIKWTPENLSMFISLWFSQNKIKKLKNNFTNYYENKKTNSWIKGLMV